MTDIKTRKGYYFYYTVILLFIHMLLPVNWADDKVFAGYNNFSTFIAKSARPIVDAFTFYLCKYHIVWRILNPFVLLILALLLSEYIPGKPSRQRDIAISLLIIFPSMVVVDAGFIATTLNYLWPVTFGLIALLPLWNRMNDKSVKLWQYFVSLPCLLYACNMQQMSCVLTAAFFCGMVYLAVKKKNIVFTLLEGAASAACLVYSYYINTVGENPRMERSMRQFFPEFGSLNILQKAELGFSSTYLCMTMDARFAFWTSMAFSVFIFVSVVKKISGRGVRIATAFPIVFSIFGLITSFVSFENVPILNIVTHGMKHYRMKSAQYFFNPVTDLIFVIIVLCTLYGVMKLLNRNEDRIIAFFLYAVGVGTRMIMGFSPTVWASGYRTFFIMFICLIAIVVMIAFENPKHFDFEGRKEQSENIGEN